MYKIGQIENNKFICWNYCSNAEEIKRFLQYMIDSLVNPESFVIVDMENKKVYNAYNIAVNFFGLYKRTLKQKMES